MMRRQEKRRKEKEQSKGIKREIEKNEEKEEEHEERKQDRKEKHEGKDALDQMTREEIHKELWETNDGESVVDDHENETTEPLNVNKSETRNEKPINYEEENSYFETWTEDERNLKIQEEMDRIVENSKEYDEFSSDPRVDLFCRLTEEMKNQWEYKQGRGWIRDTAKIIELEQIGARREIPENETFNRYGNEARKRELKSYDQYGAIGRLGWENVPEDAQVLTARFVYTIKSDPVKSKAEMTGSHIDLNRRLDARLCVQGYPEEMTEDTQSPTAQLETTRAICAIIPIKKWNFAVIDVSRAYLQADDLERDVYVRPPKGAESDPNTFWKAIKPLYGLADSTKNWAMTLRDFVLSIGAVQSVTDPSLYLWTAYGQEKWDRVIPSRKVSELSRDWDVHPEIVGGINSKQVHGMCTVYVDDVFFTGDVKFMKWFEKNILSLGYRIEGEVEGNTIIKTK